MSDSVSGTSWESRGYGSQMPRLELHKRTVAWLQRAMSWLEPRVQDDPEAVWLMVEAGKLLTEGVGPAGPANPMARLFSDPSCGFVAGRKSGERESEAERERLRELAKREGTRHG